MPHRKRLKDYLAELSIEERTPERIIECLTICLSKRPELIEDLSPGKTLVRRKMTVAERIQTASKASGAASKAAADERYEQILPVIEGVLLENPEASLAEIKRALDNSGLTPVRAAKWNRASVNYILQRAGIRAKDQP
ncbi:MULTISPECIES: hypothetical protein [unclassified Ensifer]|uniref:hypothetical protein n=1 Tax=unclassified Ensifer TaxID=2633371 RepID=UPI000812EDD6|nr:MULTISPECIES: hypothetical protein [unclassified Ensifer]OCP21966.1 hypothetical protein BC361_25700 [Ensifer sp. LC54]OCP23254.1 hypothetical protein BC363_25065 [Ensifer sp. LC384]